MKIKITNHSETNESCYMTLPGDATFYQLHAALEIVLGIRPGAHFCFMLMTGRHAIEDIASERHKLRPAFQQNPAVRYLNPYPGNQVYLLELQSLEECGNIRYPVVVGTEEDGQINSLLKKYCVFAGEWEYRNKELFRELTMAGKSVKAQKDLNTLAAYRLKTMQDKQDALYGFWRIYKKESIRITVRTSKASQTELLAVTKKESLIDYCRYAGLSIKTAWKKEKLSRCFCDNLQQNMWLSMVLLTESAMNMYLHLCRVKDNQKISLDLAEKGAALSLFLHLGIMDIVLEKGRKSFAIELSENFKRCFLKEFQSSRRFERHSPAAVYLSPELKVGGWQKIIKGYKKLDNRVGDLLRYYGIVKVEFLCEKLKECYGYEFSQDDFMKYVMLHLRLLQIAYTATNNVTRERFVSMNGVDIDYAFKVQKEYKLSIEWKSVDRSALRAFEDELEELLEGLRIILNGIGINEEIEDVILEELGKAIVGNKSWENCLELLSLLIEEMDDFSCATFWHQLSRMYLNLPVAGLGGYSRAEYAVRQQIDNPYEVLNRWKDIQPSEENVIFLCPFHTQWELFRYCEQFIKEGDEISERKMMKYARRNFGKEMAEGFRMYCYVLNGSSKLPGLLERLATEGGDEAKRIFGEMIQLMRGMEE